MNSHDLQLSRLFLKVENSVDCWGWETESWTRPGIYHEVRIWKHTGEMTCTCEDAVCRKKTSHILDAESHGCKHLRALAKMLEHTLKR